MSTLPNQEIIKKMKGGGTDALHVLSDFDKTLTLPVVDGKPVPSLISILRDHKYLTPDYPKKARALFERYHAIEINPDVSDVVKKEAMREWWTKHFELLIASGLTRDDIKKAVASRHARLRAGAHEFFALLRKHHIPLIIISSSGLGVESIGQFLSQENIDLSGVHIISNQYKWDESGKATDFRKPVIHGMNKDETVLENFPDAYRDVQQRKNILLLGNEQSDLKMSAGVPHENILCIGYLSKKEPRKGFDIVLDELESLDPITAIIKDLSPDSPT